MKKYLGMLCVVLAVLLAGCSGGTKIVPIDSLSPTQTTANVFTQEPSVTPSPTDAPIVVARMDESGMTIASRINPPTGYARVYADDASFASFMRAYPLKSAGAQVMLYTGEPRTDAKPAAVLDIMLGKKNHEGPAGAMARLFAEYFYKQGQYAQVSFTLGRDFDYTFDKWRKGNKIKAEGSSISWVGGGTDSNDVDNFKAYLANMFVYISMDTLDRDLVRVEDVDSDEIQVGDLLVGTNADGKKTAIMVADICQSKDTGEKLMLLVQGGTPAQQLHLIENAADAVLSPWYPCRFSSELVTPDLTVRVEDRYRFKKLIDEE